MDLLPSLFQNWEMIKYSILKENTFFSFGRSSKESNTLKFKLQWGAVVKPIFFNYSNKNLINLKKNTLLPKLWKIQSINSSIFLGKIISTSAVLAKFSFVPEI